MSTARIGSNVQRNWRCSVSTIHTTRMAGRLPVKEIRTNPNVDKSRLSDRVVLNFDSCSRSSICPQMRSRCNLQRRVSGISTCRDNVSFSVFCKESSTDSDRTVIVSKWLIYLATVSVSATYCTVRGTGNFTFCWVYGTTVFVLLSKTKQILWRPFKLTLHNPEFIRSIKAIVWRNN